MLLPLFAVFTAVVRGLLLFCGFWVNVVALRRCGSMTCCSGGFRKSAFLAGNVVYLTALLPFTCCLLVAVPLEVLGCRHWWFEPGTTPRAVCWLQIASCTVAASVHVGLFLGWLGEAGLGRLFAGGPPKASPVLFVWLTTVSAAFYLAKTTWVESPTTPLRHVTWNASAPASVQLLLCAETGSSAESLARHTLYLLWAFLPGVSLLLTIWTGVGLAPLWAARCPRSSKHSSGERSHCLCQSSCAWLPTAVCVLTTVTTIWTVSGRPLLALLSEFARVAYVDVGTHLILTLSALLPVTVHPPAVFRRQEEPIVGTKEEERSDLLT